MNYEYNRHDNYKDKNHEFINAYLNDERKITTRKGLCKNIFEILHYTENAQLKLQIGKILLNYTNVYDSIWGSYIDLAEIPRAICKAIRTNYKINKGDIKINKTLKKEADKAYNKEVKLYYKKQAEKLFDSSLEL